MQLRRERRRPRRRRRARCGGDRCVIFCNRRASCLRQMQSSESMVGARSVGRRPSGESLLDAAIADVVPFSPRYNPLARASARSHALTTHLHTHPSLAPPLTTHSHTHSRHSDQAILRVIRLLRRRARLDRRLRLIELLHLLVGQLPREQVQILLQMVWRVRFGDDRNVALHRPA